MTVDPGHVISLKKQQGFLNLLGQLFSMLGSKVVPHLPVLFSLLLKLAYSCNQLLRERELVSCGGEEEGKGLSGAVHAVLSAYSLMAVG